MNEGMRVVAGRELREAVRDPAFVGSNLLLLAIIVVGVIFGVVRSGGDGEPQEWRVGVVGQQAERVVEQADAQAPLFEARLDVRELDEDEAIAGLRSGDLDVVVARDESLLVEREIAPELETLLQSSFRLQGTIEALDGGEEGPEVAQESLPVGLVSPGADPGEVIAVLTGPLLFVFVYGYGYFIASAVVEEKSSRVVEVVLGAVTPSDMLAGKVLGLSLLGLAQLFILVILGTGVLLLSGLGLTLTGAIALLAMFPWFVLGFLFYGSLFAVAGSLVSRQEDFQYTQLPVLLIMLAIFGVSTAQIADPGSTLAQVLSLTPPLAPLIMPLRIGYGEATPLEFILAVALCAATAFLALRLAARLHQHSILRFGPRLTLREAWRRPN